MLAGERFVVEFGLGETPAIGLAEVMERELGILVLMVDAPDGISGAACRLPELDTILIARREVAGRRHFNLAHELFHILTWDAMPPAHCEEAMETGGNRVEQLANNFAAAVLMPAGALERFGDWSKKLIRAAEHRSGRASRDVLGAAVAAGRSRRDEASRGAFIARGDPAQQRTRRRGGTRRPPCSRDPFVEVLALAIDGGHVSLRRVAGLLELTVEDLADLFAGHGVAYPVDL